jgi:lambda repressor-like predicted transcriptional regulator
VPRYHPAGAARGARRHGGPARPCRPRWRSRQRKLSSFPAPTSRVAVSLVRVDGHFYRSGPRALLRTNPTEAEAIVSEIRRRFDASPDSLPSIGIVTFNLQQRAYIEGLLRDTEDSRILEALDDTEGLFVKNLENVQGDERDIILFSTAFSTNDRGVLPLNFGPLTRLGGERRLNVAVTRARRQVIVFSSFDPADIRTEDTSSVGIRHLRTYLEMAAHGPSVLPRDQRRPAPPDRHREQIGHALRKRGLAVRTNVGLSDFTLDLVLAEPSAPDEPLVAVLLDGPGWRRRLTARDRDALPQEVLIDALGWSSVERVWLPDWLTNADAVSERLAASVRAAAERRDSAAHSAELSVAEEPMRAEKPAGESTATVVDENTAPVEELISSAPSTLPRDRAARFRPDAGAPSGSRSLGGYEQLYAAQETTPATPLGLSSSHPAQRPMDGSSWDNNAGAFVPWTVRHLGHVDVLDALPARTASQRVAAALVEVVEAEGPIHTDRLARLVANGFGLNRVTESRKATILRHLPNSVHHDSVESVVWSADSDPGSWTGYRITPEGVDRPIEHIALREISNAMVASVQAAAGFQREDLYREVLRLFGLKRRTPGVVGRLDAALDLAERAHRLATAPGGLIVVCR